MTGDFDPKQLISSLHLGQVLGLTERRVQQLEAEHLFRNVGKGRSKRYRLDDAVQSLLAKSAIDAKRTIETASSSREMFEAERARKLKLENDENEAMLLETPTALSAIDMIFGEVRTALTGISARFSEDVAERRRLDDVIDATLADLSDRLGKAGAALAQGRDPFAADSAHDAG